MTKKQLENKVESLNYKLQLERNKTKALRKLLKLTSDQSEKISEGLEKLSNEMQGQY